MHHFRLPLPILYIIGMDVIPMLIIVSARRSKPLGLFNMPWIYSSMSVCRRYPLSHVEDLNVSMTFGVSSHRVPFRSARA